MQLIRIVLTIWQLRLARWCFRAGRFFAISANGCFLCDNQSPSVHPGGFPHVAWG